MSSYVEDVKQIIASNLQGKSYKTIPDPKNYPDITIEEATEALELSRQHREYLQDVLIGRKRASAIRCRTRAHINSIRSNSNATDDLSGLFEICH